MPDASHTLHTPILTPNASNVIAYAGPCTQSFTLQSLCLKVHRKFLMLVQVPNTSHTIPYAGPGSGHFTGQSLCSTLHTQFIMFVRLNGGDIRTGNASCISGGLLICGEPQVSYSEDIKQYIPMDSENVEGVSDYFLHIFGKRALHKEILTQRFSGALTEIDLKEEMICTIEEIRRFYGNKECNKS
ncbi:hypothetical protein O181_031517 [Austropuccinia psidii MF-1]|uniref:Uncharacterized protein n=1 Tax=Austropuccinia psidii MF-1 TaxID=1389203 RepID=A0A9Q3H5F2_9BASI|nr:hypothetical protein [Austropuccinia psidii MF-1]